MESAANFEADLKEVVEALLFVTDEPLKPQTIAQVYGDVTGSTPPDADVIAAACSSLNEHYESSGRIFRIRRWAGGFQLATEPRVDPFLRALFEERRVRKLSTSLLETLAVVAYRQPVSKPEIDAVRGVDAGYALKKLLELRLIEIVGRSDAIGRPLLYGSTDQFLSQFGLDRIEDLPRLKELEDLLADPEFQQESLKHLSPEYEAEQTANGAEEGD